MQELFLSLAPEWLNFKSLVDAHLHKVLEQIPGPDPLQKACRYAVLEGGKRLRPALCLLMAQAADPNSSPLDAAVAVEFFHIASLVADDLPCMDNDDWRRGKWTVHKKFGTATALMATYSLISEGFASLTRSCQALHEDRAERFERMLVAFECASQCTGICGITGGQYGDLFADQTNPEKTREILRKKTGCLFDLAMAFGWLFGGGCLKRLCQVQALGSDLGTAFQICDDFDDLDQQIDRPQALNTVNLWGRKQALQQLQELLQRCKSRSLELRVHSGPMLNLLMSFDGFFRAQVDKEKELVH